MATLTVVGSAATTPIGSATNISNANAVDGAVATTSTASSDTSIRWTTLLSAASNTLTSVVATLRAKNSSGAPIISTVTLLNSAGTVVATATETSVALTGSLANYTFNFAGMTMAQVQSICYIEATVTNEASDFADVDGITTVVTYTPSAASRVAGISRLMLGTG